MIIAKIETFPLEPGEGCTSEYARGWLPKGEQTAKGVLAEKTPEVDFFKGAQQKVEARRRRAVNLAS
jgi:hypothetical protein